MLASRSLIPTLDRMLTFDRAFDQALNAGWSTDGARVWVPTMDVVEKKDAYLVYAELPGVDLSKIEIDFEKNVLTIRGTRESSLNVNSNDEIRVYAAERATGAFERSIRLPEHVDGENIGAEFSNGLLTVTVPKARAAQPRKIEISVK